jgi:hypothetical protein
LLDVGTSNALVLFSKSAKMLKRTDEIYTPMNIVDFKMQLVEGLVGRLIDSQSGQEEVVEHIVLPVKFEEKFAHSALTALYYCELEEKDINAY